MRNFFDKNAFREQSTRIKMIIDTDPGVDDTACLIYTLLDDNVEVKLLTTVAGNISADKATRNLLHLLDLLKLDIPVAKGASKALKRYSPTAEFIHSAEGLGGYQPPEKANGNIIDEDAVDAMYRVLSEGNGDIEVVALGPQTNVALLLTKYPDVAKKIPRISFMGGSPFGNPDYPDHISFNLSSDPDAFKVVLESGIPLHMCPSHVGRRRAHLEEKFVYDLKEKGDVGKFLFSMYTKYWEPNYEDSRITTGDTCALLSVVYPKLFITKKAFATVDTDSAPGKTEITFSENGNITFVHDVKREEFLEFLTSELNKMKDIKLNI